MQRTASDFSLNASEKTMSEKGTEAGPSIRQSFDSKEVADLPVVPHTDNHNGPVSVEAATSQPPRLSRWRIVSLASMMMLTFFLGTLSSSAVTLAIPRMSKDLSISELQTQWVVSAYTLAYGCGQLISGRLADVFGRKICYVVGMAWFVACSIVCGCVKIYVPLCVLRALSGLGLALACPAGFGLVSAAIPHEPARSIVFAFFGLGGPVGAATGNLIGGAVTGLNLPNAWSYLFFILGGTAVIPLVQCLLSAEWDHSGNVREGLAQIDYLGGALVTVAFSAFMFSLTQAGIVPGGWSTPYIPVLLVLSISLLVAFVFWERHLELHTSIPPVAKYSLFVRHRYRISALMLCVFLAMFSTMGWGYMATIWYQNFKHLSALENALYSLPCCLAGCGVSIFAMWAASRIDAWVLFTCGMVLTGLCSLLYGVVPEGTNFFACEFIAQLCLPWGIDLVNCVGNVLVAGLVREDEQSVGGALFQTSYVLGGAFGTSISSLIIEQQRAKSDDLLSALRTSCFFSAGMGFIVVPISWLALRSIGRPGQAKNADEDED